MFREFEAVVTGTAADGFLSQSTAIIRKPGRMTRFPFLCTPNGAAARGGRPVIGGLLFMDKKITASYNWYTN